MDVDSVPAKRQAVEESKCGAVPPNNTRSIFIRVRPIAEMLEHPTPQKNNTTNETSGSSSSTSKDSHPKRKRKKKSSKKGKRSKVAAQKSGFFKWCCNNCSERFDEERLVKAHLLLAHQYATDHLIHQFDCNMCEYSNDSELDIKSHLNTVHGESDWSNKVKCNFNKITSD